MANPMTGIITNVTAIHPKAIAALPVWVIVRPYVRCRVTVDAVLAPTCCQNADTQPKAHPSPRAANATIDTGRDGKGFTSRTESSSSSSSCHPGNVARRRKVMNVNMIAMILGAGQQSGLQFVLTTFEKESRRKTAAYING